MKHLCRAGQDAEKDQAGITRPNSAGDSHNFEFPAEWSENLAWGAGKQPYQPEGNEEGNEEGNNTV